ncbi:pentatricopeptide repeat-containing protein At2g39620-like [Rutidosis leptorrhynchoides]|uniref:pentatricopeptide repeat-containing protein At2g39620-like n=1 Tax=Rutidosis leptorrhynchoides TaxID=125765 RepID=UPI003A98E2ED
MFCKMGDLTSAREVFDKMPNKDVVTWNTMIAGFSKSLDPAMALSCFKSMQLYGLEPDSVTFLNVMPAVSKLMDVLICKSIHGYVVRRSFDASIYNGLIDMYSKCRSVGVARFIFDRMFGWDDVSWEIMMAGYIHNECFVKVLELFDYMKIMGLKMSKVSIVSAIRAATETRDIEKGKEIHNCAIQHQIDSNIAVATPLVTFYVKSGDLEKAKQLFWELKDRDCISWSAIIAASVQSGYHEEALSLFQSMLNEKVRPNNVTLMSILPACAELSLLRLGQSVHCYAIRNLIIPDISTQTALVSMYGKCGIFTSAMTIFNRMMCKDVVTWNALINAHSQFGDPHCAMKMFQKLQESDISPDARTMVNLLPACAILNDFDRGSCFHGKIVKYGFEFDSHVYIALIDMYAKCGRLSSAEFLFNRAEFKKDEVSWNVVISGYVQNGHSREAISAFYKMKLEEKIVPNFVTVVTVLPAVAHLAALKEGTAIHAYILQMGFHSNTLVGNTLIDMYAKCGQLEYSEKCFNEMCNKDRVSWNAMITGLALHGLGHRAVELVSLMLKENVGVDSTSFLSVLSACRHAGLVEEGKAIFSAMYEIYHLEPDSKHYACMVDLLGHAGLIDEALELINTMPFEPDAGVWGALQSACQMHSRVEIAELASDRLVKLEPENPTHFVVLSSIYSRSGRWTDAGNPRSEMKETGLRKSPGCSWVEVKDAISCTPGG